MGRRWRSHFIKKKAGRCFISTVQRCLFDLQQDFVKSKTLTFTTTLSNSLIPLNPEKKCNRQLLFSIKNKLKHQSGASPFPPPNNLLNSTSHIFGFPSQIFPNFSSLSFLFPLVSERLLMKNCPTASSEQQQSSVSPLLAVSCWGF